MSDNQKNPSDDQRLPVGIPLPTRPNTTRASWTIPIQITVTMGAAGNSQGGVVPNVDVQAQTTHLPVDHPADKQIQLQAASFHRGQTPLDSPDQLASQQVTLVGDPSANHGQDASENSLVFSTPVTRGERWGSRTRAFLSDIRNALRPGVDENALKSIVWYIESSFSNGVQLGTGVVLRVTGQGISKNLLLTCQHVVRDKETGADANRIRCWSESSGYNPNSSDTKNIWTAKPFLWRTSRSPNDFLNDGGLDWVMLEVTRENQSFDTELFAAGFTEAKMAFRQALNPYRLVGFPGGNMTMNRDVVKASISRDFRLTGTDAKPGQVVLTGSESTAPGFSGAPYLTPHGQVVAIHRSLFRGANTLTGVATRPIEVELADQGWSLVKQTQKYWRYWAIRISALVMAFLAVYAVLIASIPTKTFDLVEKSNAIWFLDPNAVSVGTQEKPSEIGVGTGTIQNGVLNYTAKAFDSSAHDDRTNSEFVITDEFRYRRRWLGFVPVPSGRIRINIRKHLDNMSVDQLYDRLYATSGEIKDETQSREIRNLWEDKNAGPVLTIHVKGGNESLMEQNGIVEFKQPAAGDRPEIIIKWNIGNFAIPKDDSLYLQNGDYQLRQVVIVKAHDRKKVPFANLDWVTLEVLSILENDPRTRYDPQ